MAVQRTQRQVTFLCHGGAATSGNACSRAKSHLVQPTGCGRSGGSGLRRNWSTGDEGPPRAARPERWRLLSLRASDLPRRSDDGPDRLGRASGPDSFGGLFRGPFVNTRGGLKPCSRAASAGRSPGAGPLVSFARSGLTVRWRPSEDRSLLELAESCDVPVRWSCRTGVCHNCESGLISGSVAYQPDPLDPPAEGNVLICCSRPQADIVIDI